VIGLLVAVLVFAVVCYVVTQIPMPQPVRNIVFAVLAVVLLVWLLSAAGLFGPAVVVPVR
jgi:hypothetical protein